MGIKSTRDISREFAISRIRQIAQIIASSHYLNLEAAGHELIHPNSIIDAPDEQALAAKIIKADFSSWTDQMLEDIIDRPFYRISMFDNYLIEKNLSS